MRRDDLHTDYDTLAAGYHQRYAVNPLDGIAQELRRLAAAAGARRALEVGCGSGHWIADLSGELEEVWGLEPSAGMLREAAARTKGCRLVCASANQLPFAPSSFDLVYSVNAVHHFPDARAYVSDASTLLRPGGVLAVIGINPDSVREWYFYEYFPGTREIDRRRYSSVGQLLDWMLAARLEEPHVSVADRSISAFAGLDVLADPFLKKGSNSLLSLLSDEAYAEGLQSIQAAAQRGATFRTELEFWSISARSPRDTR